MREIYIIMPCFNGEKYIEKAIDSFVNQKYKNKKLVIIDGKSSDESHSIISRYQKNHSEIKWIKERDNGISDAINIGIAEIPDDSVFGYLGIDDILMPGTLETVAQSLIDFRLANAIIFESIILSSKGKSVYRKFPCTSFDIDSLSRHGTIAGLQNFFCESAIVKKMKFSTSKKYAMDYDIYFRFIKNNLIKPIMMPMASSINIQDNNITNLYATNGYEERLIIIYENLGASYIYFREKFKFTLHKIKKYLTIQWLA